MPSLRLNDFKPHRGPTLLLHLENCSWKSSRSMAKSWITFWNDELNFKPNHLCILVQPISNENISNLEELSTWHFWQTNKGKLVIWWKSCLHYTWLETLKVQLTFLSSYYQNSFSIDYTWGKTSPKSWNKEIESKQFNLMKIWPIFRFPHYK